MTSLADLMIELGVDPSGVEEGMSKGKAMAAAGGAAIAGAIGAAAFKAMDISAANDKLAAQLGLNEAESARVGAVAGKLYANAYGDSVEDVNVAVGAVMSSIKGMSSASSSDLQAITGTALDFATAFDVDVQRAVDVAGRAINAGLAPDATAAFDLITAASQKVPANLREDVLDAVDEYGQFFNTIGVSGPNAMGMLVDAANKGMFGIDKVGDAIKEFTILSTDGSKRTMDAYKAIGVDGAKMSNAILAGGDSAAGATQKIVKGLLGIKDPTEQAATALALFGTPLEDLNVKDIPEFLKTLGAGSDSLGDFGGAASRMGATLNDNASTNLTSFKRQAETAFVGLVGGKVIPIADNVARTLATGFGPALAQVTSVMQNQLVPAAEAVSRFVGDNQTTFTVIAGIIAAVFIPHLAMLAVQYVKTTAKAIWAWTTQKASAIQAAAATSLNVAKIVAGWVVMGAQAMAQAARIAAAWLISIGPIALVIAAVVGLVVLIVKYWDQIKAATVAVWNAIKAAVSAAWEAIKAAVSAAVSFVANLIRTYFTIMRTIVETYVRAWLAVITTVWSGIKAAVKAGVDFVLSAINGWKKIVSTVTGIFTSVVSGVAGKIGDVVSKVKELPGKVTGALSGAGKLLLETGKDIVRGLISGIGSMAGDVTDALLGLIPGPLKKFAGKLGIGSPSKVFKELGMWTGKGYALGVESTQKLIGSVMDKVTDRIKAKVAEAKTMAEGIRDSFRQFGDITSFNYAEGAGSSNDLIKQLEAQAAAAEQFTAAIAGLRTAGLNGTTLDQLIGAGPGALDDAQRLLEGGQIAIARANQLTKRIDAAGQALGGSAAAVEYGVNPYGKVAAGMLKDAKNDHITNEIRVFIGDKELKAIVAEERKAADRETKRTVKSGKRNAA